MQANNVGDYQYCRSDIIGHGAFAIVFKGHSRVNTDQQVAIKCVTKKNLMKQADLLTKEIQILKNLAEVRHKNIVALLDCHITAENVYLVMEYCNGGDFHDYLLDHRINDEPTIAHFLRQIASAMHVFNSMGIVHRDLKPQNLLLCHRGKLRPPASEITIKIADFGFARILSAGVMAETLCGSPLYMAPEVLLSRHYDAKADLWSVAVIIYQCLTGTAPFTAKTPQLLSQLYLRSSHLQPRFPVTISANLKHLLEGLLKRDPNDRMDFHMFFHHPFLSIMRPGVTTSSVIPGFNTCQTTTLSIRPSASESRLTTGVPRYKSQGNKQSAVQPSAGSGPLQPPQQFVLPHPAAGLCPLPTASRDQPLRSSSPCLDDFVIVPDNLSDLTDCSSMSFSSSLPSSVIRPNVSRASQLPCLSMPTTTPLPQSPQAQAIYHPSSPCSTLTPVNFGQPPSVNIPGTLKSGPWMARQLVGTPSSTTVCQVPSSASPLPKDRSLRHSSGTSAESLSPPPIQFYVDPSSPSSTAFLSRRRSSSSSTSPVPFLGHRVRTEPCLETSLSSEHTGSVSPSPSFPHMRFLFVADSPRDTGRFKHCSSLACITETVPAGCAVSRQSLHRRLSEPVDRASPPMSRLSTNMEDMMTFIVPELSERTLLQKEHSALLSKFEFVIDMANCIVGVAQERSSPLSESLYFDRSSASSLHSMSLGQSTFLDETQRYMEQLVLYVRALHLLASALTLARQAVREGKLPLSKSTTEILTAMNATYQQCLSECRHIARPFGLPDYTQASTMTQSMSADRLLYHCAIDMCKLGAVDEQLGNFEQCIQRYKDAHIILDGLCQQAENACDRIQLLKYKEGIEKRLRFLGIVPVPR